MKKRIADILEKICVGSLLIALFQGVWVAYLVFFVTLVVCLKLTKELENGN